MAGLIHVTAALALALTVGACASFGGPGRPARIENATLPVRANETIAQDLVGHLKAELGQGKASLWLDSEAGRFGTSLETVLRINGYAVVPIAEAQADSVPLSYVVEPFEPGVLVRIAIPSLSLGRLYRVEGDDAVPAGPLSISRTEP